MKTIFYGGKIITMENQLYADAVLTDDGKIVAVGNKNELLNRYSPKREIDLKGMVMLPGFIDTHSHFTQVAAASLQISLEGVSSLAEMKERIKLYTDKNKIAPGRWLVARDYDNNLMPCQTNPTLNKIDSLSPENPLIIQHKSGHMGLFNSIAMDLLGIDKNTSAPEGGHIEVDSNGPTGYMEENAFFFYLKKVPMASPEDFVDSFYLVQTKYASYGITTVQDGMMVKEMIPIYQLLLSKNILKLDLVSYSDITSFMEIKNSFSDHISKYSHHLRLGGIKIFLDGSPQGKTAWMRTPYNNTMPEYFGYGTMSDEAVIQAFKLAAKEKTQLLAHCNGDAAASQFLRCLEQAESEYPVLKKLRPVIIHGQFIGIDQLYLAHMLGAIVSFFIAHVYHWGDVHISNFTAERAAKISPAASALKLGVPFTFHQDSPVIEPNMLETIWCAVNRITKSGVHLGEDEEITTLDALRAVTINAAYQYGEENEKGSIRAGKTADFTILDADPLQTPRKNLRSINVIQTYKDGICIYERN